MWHWLLERVIGTPTRTISRLLNDRNEDRTTVEAVSCETIFGSIDLLFSIYSRSRGILRTGKTRRVFLVRRKPEGLFLTPIGYLVRNRILLYSKK